MPVRFVLEIKAGIAQETGIEPGTRSAIRASMRGRYRLNTGLADARLHMQFFRHDGFDLAFLDSPAAAMASRFCSSTASPRRCVNWINPGWIKTLNDAGYRRSRSTIVATGARQEPRSGRLSPRRHGRRCAALLDHLGIERPMSSAIPWARAFPPSWRLRHPERVATLVFGGLGIGMVEGVGDWDPIAGPAGRGCRTIENPRGRMFRAFADQTGATARPWPPASRPRGSSISEADIARIAQPTLIGVGTRDDIAGSAEAGRLMPNAVAFDDRAPRPHAVGRRPLLQGARARIPEGASALNPKPIEWLGAEGNRLAADLWDGHGHPVVLLHGGGQTRHAWDETARRIAVGRNARRHGRPARPRPERLGRKRQLRLRPFRRGCGGVFRQVADMFHAAPSAVGASLGGLSALTAECASAGCWNRWSWSTSRRGSIPTAWRAFRAS
jgi:pimeloyl-ACP methyl ester carboxylesterase